ncbi:helix-turn-helix transcriptional regulator [Ruegeria pomeroyi]|nr:helix-turn-helix transcriptional regulator [Ruegeria pomeroyi]MCE8523531.1 helix-turn-helix transcriptional regulator [Ruegeria pomeroyi]MCE8527540.1 helix-turn-helix transcriptional regulator [Ruegeria pomeroyi]MCE8530870.1 helix-turn-helix transcriptional regulator [Ruegeria pomeroyi]MCE8535743.1 helix-turn-helix transcriptional regulator [Ruegeria pomeroyi]
MGLSDRDIHRLRSAMSGVGTPGFFPAFRRLLRARISFATFIMIRFDPGKAPVMLDAWFVSKRLPSAALTEYLSNTFPFDPFYQFLDLPPGGGLYRLPEIAPDRFFSSEYYLEYYRKTGLCDEVGLLAPLPSGARAHLSVSRFERSGPYRRREIQCLKHHAPVLLELLAQHVAAISPTVTLVPPVNAPSLADLIRVYAAETLAAQLTRREAQIAALVLQGHSNGSAALMLNNSRETCKVHRRNLYRKLAISSQRDLFGLLKHLL